MSTTIDTKIASHQVSHSNADLSEGRSPSDSVQQRDMNTIHEVEAADAGPVDGGHHISHAATSHQVTSMPCNCAHAHN